MNFSTVKSITIPEGKATKITSGGVVIWQKPPSYTNLVPTAIGADRSIYYDVGYARGRRLMEGLTNKSVTASFDTSGADYTTIGIMPGIAKTTADIYVYGLNFNTRVGDVIATYNTESMVCRYSKSKIYDGYADGTKFTLTKLGDAYFKISLSFVLAIDGIAISGVTASGITPVVTVNEPIF